MIVKHPGFSSDASSHWHSTFAKVLLLRGALRPRVTSFQLELHSKPKEVTQEEAILFQKKHAHVVIVLLCQFNLQHNLKLSCEDKALKERLLAPVSSYPLDAF